MTKASVLSKDQHDEIWAIQKPLNFPLFVYGVDRAEADMVKITKRLAEALASHKHDAAKGLVDFGVRPVTSVSSTHERIG